MGVVLIIILFVCGLFVVSSDPRIGDWCVCLLNEVVCYHQTPESGTGVFVGWYSCCLFHQTPESGTGVFVC
jgi:hypothetical protein